jgi:two-component system response regulator HydG
VAINVAALPAELLESELFGHAKGAFTGATAAKAGLFAEADGGTLLLDEIAEMPLALQAKLLRVLQDGEVRPVGEVRPFQVDVRILCATHQDLAQAVAERRFRQDLYYRLKVFTLVVPPLRERKEDVLPLAEMFLELEEHPTGRFTTAARRALLEHSWPGNVRELANAVKHGAVLSARHRRDVDLVDLPDELSAPATEASMIKEPRSRRLPPVLQTPGASASNAALPTLAEVEREHIVSVLEAAGGSAGEAARALGISRTTLWRRLKALGLSSR